MADDRTDQPRPVDLATLTQLDAAVAADLLRLLVLGLDALVQRGGMHLAPRTRAILFALHEASERHEKGAETMVTPGGDQEPRETLTVREMAERRGCSPRNIRQLLTAGRLAGRKSGGVWIVHPEPAGRL